MFIISIPYHVCYKTCALQTKGKSYMESLQKKLTIYNNIKYFFMFEFFHGIFHKFSRTESYEIVF
jgi:hypothetical protein